MPNKPCIGIKKQPSKAMPSHLGLMYAKGDGVLKNLSQSKKWMQKAYDNNDKEVSKAAEI